MSPYSQKVYGSRKKWEKYKKCVKKVKKKGGVRSPYAICRKSVYGLNAQKKT